VKILAVDDSQHDLELFEAIIDKIGGIELVRAGSAEEAFGILGISRNGKVVKDIDLILLDIHLPMVDGIEACKKIKSIDAFRDLPIVVVTAMGKEESLQPAFDAGAIDFLEKPFNKVEFIARVNSVLKLKREMDLRKAREKELEEATRKLSQSNRELERLSRIDSLTGLSNRMHFDELFEREWKRCARDKKLFSIILIDIDYFRAYNDAYGMQEADTCLRKIGQRLAKIAQRPADLVSRYSADQFAIILPEIEPKDAEKMAKDAHGAIEAMKIEHKLSKVSSYVSVSIGCASDHPSEKVSSYSQIKEADKALVKAKREGRNRIVCSKT